MLESIFTTELLFHPRLNLPAVFMLFPISDDDRHLTKPAYVTYVLLGLNLALFLVQMSNPEFTYGWSVIPKEITTGVDLVDPIEMTVGKETISIPQAPGPIPIWLTLFTAMFMHGGVGHIGGNMLYLWIFGDNVEHRFGPIKFLIFYLLAGLAASFAQIFMNPEGIIPNLGASGAIAGIMGAYMVLFPRNKVNAVFFYSVISIPAILVLGMWIAMQFMSGYGSMFQTESTGGVAYWAHIGGFVAGVGAGLFARISMTEEPDSILRRNYDHDQGAKRIW